MRGLQPNRKLFQLVQTRQHWMVRYVTKTVRLLTRLSLLVTCDIMLLTRHSCQMLAWACCCGKLSRSKLWLSTQCGVWCLWLLQAQQQRTAQTQTRFEYLSRHALDDWTVNYVLPAHAACMVYVHRLYYCHGAAAVLDGMQGKNSSSINLDINLLAQT